MSLLAKIPNTRINNLKPFSIRHVSIHHKRHGKCTQPNINTCVCLHHLQFLLLKCNIYAEWLVGISMTCSLCVVIKKDTCEGNIKFDTLRWHFTVDVGLTAHTLDDKDMNLYRLYFNTIVEIIPRDGDCSSNLHTTAVYGETTRSGLLK